MNDKKAFKTYEGSIYSSSNQYFDGNGRRFCDIFPKASDFVDEYLNNNVLTKDLGIIESEFQSLYYLLYSKYGGRQIASDDTTIFKYGMARVIFSRMLVWRQRLKVQQEVAKMGLTSDDIVNGTSMIYNHAINPSVTPSTATTSELPYINDQNVSKSKRGRLEAFNALLDTLRTDVTADFLDSFEHLFICILDGESAYYEV